MAISLSKASVAEAWQPESLPPFPALAVKALNMMAGNDTSLIELCDLIRSDTAFSTEILKIANSPLVAFSKNINSVLQTSMLLGFRRLRSIVITVGLKAYLAGPFTPLLHSCWQHSVACAMIAERAAKACLFDKDFAYTSGIMHDIGRVALAVSMHQAYEKVAGRGADQPRDLLQTEREFCGLDHCQAGETLITTWGLPQAFLEITSTHHNPKSSSRGTDSLLAPSCVLADALGFGVVRYRKPRSYADILAGFPESARHGFPAQAEKLAAEIAREIKLIESV